MKKIIFSLLLTVTFLSFKTSYVLGFIGVSPADITFDDLLPGGHYEKKFTLSRWDLKDDLTITIESAVEGADSWFTVEPDFVFTFPRGQRTQEIKIKIDVPQNADLKNFQGLVTIQSQTQAPKSSSVSVVQGVGIAVNMVTTKLTVDRLMVRNLKMEDAASDQPLKMTIRVENQGNSETSLESATVKVMNTKKEVLGEFEDRGLDTIKPTEVKDIVAEFKHSLGEGEYFGQGKVYFQGRVLGEQETFFKILTATGRPVVSKEISGIRDVFNSLVKGIVRNALPLGMVTLGVIGMMYFSLRLSIHKRIPERLLGLFRKRKKQ